jgi:hypothetical protein
MGKIEGASACGKGGGVRNLQWERRGVYWNRCCWEFETTLRGYLRSEQSAACQLRSQLHCYGGRGV